MSRTVSVLQHSLTRALIQHVESTSLIIGNNRTISSVYGHTVFEYEFRIRTPVLSNQNKAFIRCTVPIG